MRWNRHLLSLFILLYGIISCDGEIGDPVDAAIGRPAVLPCKVDFSGNPTVIWMDPQGNALTRNEEPITGDDRFSIERPYAGEWNLRITNVKAGDRGNYTCMISAASTQMWKYVYLRIVSAPIIVSSSPDTEVETGNDITLECEAEGIPEPVISWYRETYYGEKLALASEGGSLTVVNVSRHDAGTYRCEANNGVPPRAHANIRLDIMFAPLVTLPHQYTSQEEGRDTFLQCIITANPHLVTHWRKDGNIIEDSDRHRTVIQDMEHYNRSMLIFISDLQNSDFGSYECVAENDYGSAAGTMGLIKWQSNQVRITSPPEDTVSSQTLDVRLNCTVENMGHTDSIAWWRHHPLLGFTRIFESHPSGGRPPVYLDTDKYTIVGHYDLVIKNVTFEDGGEYFCEVVGKQNHTAGVTVVDELECDTELENENKTFLDIGDTAFLNCFMPFSGPQRIWQAIWSHNDRKLSSIDEDEVGYLKRVLTFPAFAKDSGEYTCVLSSLQPAFNKSCKTHVHVLGQEATPAPLCKSDPWNIASSSLAIIVAACVGGTTLIFFIILIAVCRHYKLRLRKERPVETTARFQKNGSVNLETSHLTAQEADEQEV